MKPQPLQVVKAGQDPHLDPIDIQLIRLNENLGNGRPLTAFQFQGFKETLRKYSLEEITAAVSFAIENRQFMPKPSELKAIIIGNPDDRVAAAWEAVLTGLAHGGMPSVRFYDPAAARAVDATFESWSGAIRMTGAGWLDARGRIEGGCSNEMLASYAKTFGMHYRSFMSSGAGAELYRRGETEASYIGGVGGWADMPGKPEIIRIPVILIDPAAVRIDPVGGRAVRILQLPYSVKQMRLTEGATAALNAGPLAAFELSEIERPQLPERPVKALPPGPDIIPATPAEGRALIADMLKGLSERAQSMKAQLQAAPVIENPAADPKMEKAMREKMMAQDRADIARFKSIPDPIDPNAKALENS